MAVRRQGAPLDHALCWACEPERASNLTTAISQYSVADFDAVQEFDGLAWDASISLPRAAVRLKPRWKMALGRYSKRPVAGLTTLAIVALTAACASAVRSTPDEVRAPALAVTTPMTRVATSDTLTNKRALRAGHPSEPKTPVPAKIATAPAQVTFAAIEETPQTREAQIEDGPALLRSPSIFGHHDDGMMSQPVTELVAFDSAPFPYNGMQPQGVPFLDVDQGGQKGHRTRRGQILWESTTFNDRRVLVHIPSGFDPNRPAVIVVFFHGFGATLSRDVLARQQVPAQISASGANAVLLAPQFAVDARDSSAGRFWEAGGFARFLKEASQHLAHLEGDPALQRRFARMPVILVAYSGGFLPAAWSLKDVAATNRVRGVLLLDAAYGELERFANFAASNRTSFLISAYTQYTQRQNAELEQMLEMRGLTPETQMSPTLSKGGTIFLSTGTDASHMDYVTQAWTGDPIKDVLTRLPEFRLREPRTVAAVDLNLTSSERDANGAIQ